MKRLHDIEVPSANPLTNWVKEWFKEYTSNDNTYIQPIYQGNTTSVVARPSYYVPTNTWAASSWDYDYGNNTTADNDNWKTIAATCNRCGTVMYGILPRGKTHMALQHISRDSHRYNYT